MLSGRRIGEFGSLRRNEGSLSARKLSARHSIVLHRHFSPKRRWRLACHVARFVVRLRQSVAKPQLTAEEKVEVTSRYYDVMCLNNVSQISDFVASVGLHVGDEEWSNLLSSIRFVNGRALTLHQVLRLMRILKRKHLEGISSDTQEAFSALAVDGKIPMEIFSQTLDRFDLRIQLDSRRNSSSAQDGPGSIDLERFNILLSDNVSNRTDGKTQSLAKRSIAPEAVFGSRTAIAQPIDEVVAHRRVDCPRTMDNIFSLIQQSLGEKDLFDIPTNTEKRKVRTPGFESPQRIRHEVFPVKTHHERWTFKEVESRISEVESRPDVARTKASRNVHYCSDEKRPPLARVIPRLSPVTIEEASASNHLSSFRTPTEKRSLSVPLLTNRAHGLPRYPILENRREKMMDSLPHRDFAANGSSDWMLPVDARASLIYAHRSRLSSQSQNIELRSMAAVALKSIVAYSNNGK